MQITERQREILKTVVEEYILTTVPVPSERVAGRPGLKVSSATVRNEMMELEEMGLLTHPHTSAGRVPSDLGYRYYIDHLMPETTLSPAEKQTIWHQFHQVEAELDEWGPLAAAVMAQMARVASLVTRLHSSRGRLRRVELVSVQDDLILVVLILGSGSLRQRLLRLDRAVGRAELVKMANRLSDLLSGMNSAQVAVRAAGLSGMERDVALHVARVMQQSERGWGDLYYEGIGYISGEPEFGRTERLMGLVDVLHRGWELEPLFSEVVESGVTKIVVGSENPSEQMRACSVVLQRYGAPGQAAGVIGVVGPTRMRYWRAVSLVRFMADLLDRLVHESLR